MSCRPNTIERLRILLIGEVTCNECKKCLVFGEIWVSVASMIFTFLLMTALTLSAVYGSITLFLLSIGLLVLLVIGSALIAPIHPIDD